jgi:hypothetical protein
MYLAACESRAEESAAPPSNHLVRRHPRCHGGSAYKSGSHLALRGKRLATRSTLLIVHALTGLCALNGRVSRRRTLCRYIEGS